MNHRRRVIGLFYAFQFFFSLLLWAPIFYEFQKQLGLDDTQIFGIQSLYYLSFVFLELPTGFLSDRWGHRFCMRLGGLTLAVANLLPVFVPTYGGFLAHWLMIAAARSLISGAASAYIYDYLKLAGEPEWFKRAEGRARALSMAGKVAGWAGIGFVMEHWFNGPYVLTAVAGLLSALVAQMLPEVDACAAEEERPSLKGAFRVLWTTPVLVLVMLQGIAIFVLARIVQVNLFQPILAERSYGVAAFGVVMAVTTLFEVLGSARPEWMQRWADDRSAVFLLTVFMAATMALMAESGPLGTVAWMCLFAFGAGLVYPIQRQLLNDVIPSSSYRATLMSLESVLDRAACAGMALALAPFVAQGRLDTFLHLSAALTAVSVVVLVWAFRRLAK